VDPHLAQQAQWTRWISLGLPTFTVPLDDVEARMRKNGCPDPLDTVVTVTGTAFDDHAGAVIERDGQRRRNRHARYERRRTPHPRRRRVAAAGLTR
jgi:hypothetical protein